MLNRRELMAGAGTMLLAHASPALAGDTRLIGGPAFGSWWRAVVPTQTDAVEIADVMQHVISAVDNAMSPFIPDSEISLINRNPDPVWHSLSPDTATVVAESLHIARMTQGAFDPTVGPVVGRYGFGPIQGGEAAGYASLQLDGRRLRKNDSSATLDLCGIAKGYALDRMAAALDALSVRSFLLEVGGEVRARGLHPSGRWWLAGIETPGIGTAGLQRVVHVDHLALATSGDSINGGQQGGIAFNHIIDPQTGAPVSNGVTAVSVLAGSGMKADAMATALLVMGVERGLAFANANGVAALFLKRESAGVSELMSESFAQHIVT